MEYKMLVEKPMDLQKKLNQWKHTYDLHIVSTVPVTHKETLFVSCLLIRRDKEPKVDL